MDFGAPTAELVDASTLNFLALIGPGNNTFSSRMDVRAYNSYYYMIQASVGVATKYNSLILVNNWYADATTGPALYSDLYEFFVDQSGTFAFITAQQFLQDTMHGPFMDTQLFAPASNAQAVSIDNIYLAATSRQISSPFQRTENSADCFLAVQNGTVTAGNTVTIPCQLGYGPCQVHVRASSQILTVNITWGTANANAPYSYTVAANTNDDRVINFPKRGASIALVNGTASNTTYNMFVTRQLAPV